MPAFILITGTLFRNPEQRTSKAGKPYVTATLSVKDGEESQFWNIVAFAEGAQTELMRLGEGDSISIQGALRVETYPRPAKNASRLASSRIM
jgi:single-stranded DNA-binding protein